MMIKAIFLSYTGVVLPRRGNEYRELIETLVRSSNLKDYDKANEWFINTLRQYKLDAKDIGYMHEEDLIRKMFEETADQIHLSERIERMLVLVQNSLLYGPVSDELANFFVLSHRPIYIISDCSREYVQVEMKRNHLHPHGIFGCAEVRSYRDSAKVFDYALKQADLDSSEVLYIGEDVQLDMLGASRAGIQSIVLDRRGDTDTNGFRRIRSLSSILANLGD
ncbi:MAG: HAD family hydrolase [Bulleidia sp.]